MKDCDGRAGVDDDVVVGDLLAGVGGIAEARAAVGVAVGARGNARDSDGVVGACAEGRAHNDAGDAERGDEGDDEGPTDAGDGATGGGCGVDGCGHGL